MRSRREPFGADSTNPWRQRRFLVAAGFLGAVAVLGLWLAIAGRPASSGNSAGPASSATPPPDRGRPHPATRSKAPAVQTVPTTAPSGIAWRLYAGVLLPFSATAGPEHVTDGLATGFTHTPTGALVAAAQIGPRILIAPDWRRVVAQQVVPNDGRSQYIALRSQVSGQATGQPGAYRQYAGFQFVTYSASMAVIDLVTAPPSGSSGGYEVVATTVTWSKGDWRVQLSANGGQAAVAQVVPTLLGYVPWGGI
jgi:hypothetical protein